MAKHLNNETEALIETDICPVNTNGLKEGDIVPHHEVCSIVTIYVPHYGEYGAVNKYTKHQFTIAQLRDIVNQVEKIESVHFEKAYQMLPF